MHVSLDKGNDVMTAHMNMMFVPDSFNFHSLHVLFFPSFVQGITSYQCYVGSLT